MSGTFVHPLEQVWNNQIDEDVFVRLRDLIVRGSKPSPATVSWALGEGYGLVRLASLFDLEPWRVLAMHIHTTKPDTFRGTPARYWLNVDAIKELQAYCRPEPTE